MKAVFICSLVLVHALALQAQFVPVPAPAQQGPILLKGGTVHIGTGAAPQVADVLLVGGKINGVGPNLSAAGATVVDVSGKQVYPGLIAVNTTLGLNEIEAVRATRDAEEVGQLNPNARALVGYNTDSHVQPTVRSNGVLLAQIAPGGELVSGISAVVQLDAWNWEDATYLADDALHIQWPAVQTLAYAHSAEAGKKLRERLEKELTSLDELFTQASGYAQERAAGRLAGSDLRLEALQPFITGQKPVYLHAQHQVQIEAALAFANKFKLKPVIVGGYDAWRIADQLKAANAPVVIVRTHSLPGRTDDAVDLPYRLPKLLQDAGIRFCITDEGYWRQRNLPFEAGTAAAYGLTPEEALRSITLDAARILGIDLRTGSIEVGKDANLVVSQGDLLDMRTNQVTDAYLQGRRINLMDKHKELYHRFQQKYAQPK